MGTPRRRTPPRPRVQQPTLVDWAFIGLCLVVGIAAIVAGLGLR